MHPAYSGLASYDSLKARSNAHYDEEDAALRAAPDSGSFNNTQSLMNNQVSKFSSWAPYFQALQDQGVNKVGMDAGRPHGLASQPEWGADLALQQDPSTNIAGAQPVSHQSRVLNGLNLALPSVSRGQFGAGLKGY